MANAPSKQSPKTPARTPHQPTPPKNPAKGQGKHKEIETDDNMPEKEDETASTGKENISAKDKRGQAAVPARKEKDDEKDDDDEVVDGDRDE